MNRAGLATFTLGFAALAGCVSFEPAPLSLDRAAEDLDARSLADPGLRAYLAKVAGVPAGDPVGRIWTLDELTAVALYFRSGFESTVRRADVAEAGVGVAAQVPNPTLSASPGYNTSSSGISPWILDLGLAFPIELAGKRAFRTDEARHRAEAARLAVAAAAWEIRRGVREALTDVGESEEMRRVEQEAAAAQTALAELLERLRAAGEMSAFEALTARTAADRARAAAVEAAGRASVARVRLAMELGLPSRALDGVAMPPAAAPDRQTAPDAAAARRAALTGRADLLSALAEYAASQSALQRAIAGQYPDLDLGPGYEFDQGENKWSVGVSFTLPLFNRNRAAIAEAVARREEAAAAVLALQERIAGDVDAALAECDSMEGQRAAAEAIVAAAALRLAAAEALRRAGETDESAVLAARADAARCRADSARIKWNTSRAFGRLEDALQRPVDLPESVWKAAGRAKR